MVFESKGSCAAGLLLDFGVKFCCCCCCCYLTVFATVRGVGNSLELYVVGGLP